MSLGQPPSKSAIDNAAGSLARALHTTLRNVAEFKSYLDTKSAEDLETEFGYTAGEAAVLKSAVADLDQLRGLYEGEANLADAKDFRTFAKRLFGFAFGS